MYSRNSVCRRSPWFRYPKSGPRTRLRLTDYQNTRRVSVFELSEVLPLTCVLVSGRVTTKGSVRGLAAYTHHQYTHVRLRGLLV
jgi:hypothetical protein